MTCFSPPSPAELTALRAELAAAHARAERAEATAHLQAEALARLTARLVVQVDASAMPPPAPSPRSERVTEERHASRVTPPPSRVTRHAPSVTEADKTAHQRALAAARSRACRLRKKSVTAERDGVTPNVMKEEEKKEVTTPPPSFVTQASVTPVTPLPSAGRLRLQASVAARETREQQRADAERSPLPPGVVALREGWERLVVGSGRGFTPWPSRTSARLVQDAMAALERRPLDEWLRVFALVPRSPVCRGELGNRRRLDLLWLLKGESRDGYEPAEKLLTGAWTVDPEEPSPASDGEPAPEPPAEVPAEVRPADEAWRRVLASMRAAGLKYAVSQVGLLLVQGVASGVLELVAQDRFRQDFVEEHYGPLLREHAARCGLAGVQVAMEGAS